MLFSITVGMDISAFADELTTGKCGDNVTYTFDSTTGKLVISGTGRMYDYKDPVYYSNHSPFYDIEGIDEIIIEDGISYIGKYAFSYCEANNIVVPESVVDVGEYVFSNSYVKKVTIENGLSYIGEYMFYECKELKSLILPDSIESIGSRAFCGSSIKLISIPAGIKSIASYAFCHSNYRNSNLEDVFFKGTKEDWNKVSIGDENGKLTSATFHYETANEEIIYSGNDKINVANVIDGKMFRKHFDSVNSTVYNPKLAYMLAGLSRAAYSKDNIKKSLLALGFGDYVIKEYGKDKFNAGYSIGKQKLSDGSTLVLITVRGSSNTGNWISDINCITTNGTSGNHVGFDTSANNVYNNLKSFMGDEIPTSNVKYVITGHSLGAATANLLSMKLSNAGVPKSKVYNYNFACPDVARGNDLYWNPNGIHDNMFNIGYCKDYVSLLPGVTLNLGNANTWGKYGRSYWFSKDWSKSSEIDIDLSFKAHDAKNYVDYLEKLNVLSKFKNWSEMTAARAKSKVKSIIHCFHCPVDVDVYDSNGKLVASVKNNEVVYQNSENGEVLVFVEGDEKYVSVPENKKYDIRLTGTDNGKMTYNVVKTDLTTQEVEDEKTFSNVSLTEGKEMQTSSIANSDVDLYVVDNNHNVVAVVKENGSETPIVSITKAAVSGIKTKVYCGKNITQALTVKVNGKALKNGTDFTISYTNNKNVGKATLTITGKGVYKGTITKTFKIIPKGTTVLKVTIPKKKQLKVTWKKQVTQTTGYQIQYSTDKNFKKGNKTVTVSKNKTTSTTIKKLKSKKKYYVRIRTYKTVGKSKYYSSWGKSKAITIK